MSRGRAGLFDHARGHRDRRCRPRRALADQGRRRQAAGPGGRGRTAAGDHPGRGIIFLKIWDRRPFDDPRQHARWTMVDPIGPKGSTPSDLRVVPVTPRGGGAEGSGRGHRQSIRRRRPRNWPRAARGAAAGRCRPRRADQARDRRRHLPDPARDDRRPAARAQTTTGCPHDRGVTRLIRVIDALHAEIAAMKANDVAALDRATQRQAGRDRGARRRRRRRRSSRTCANWPRKRSGLNETARIYVNLMAANVRRRLQMLAGDAGGLPPRWARRRLRVRRASPSSRVEHDFTSTGTALADDSP